MSNDVPPCKNWRVWTGREIEGTASLGKETLFIRSNNCALTQGQWGRLFDAHDRIWFCAGYADWDVVRVMLSQGKEVCVEVPVLGSWPPADILSEARIYWKLPIPAKLGDHLCVGPAYSDESFCVGTGNKVSATDYHQDVFIA